MKKPKLRKSADNINNTGILKVNKLTSSWGRKIKIKYEEIPKKYFRKNNWQR